MRIGVLGHGFLDWGGGIDFLRALVSSLHHTGEAVDLHLLVPSRGPRLSAQQALRQVYRMAKAALGDDRVPAGRRDSHSLARLVSDAAARPIPICEVDIGAPALERAARKLSVDALFPSIVPLPADFRTPWVGYIFDFQHRYFPQLFTSSERARRDRDFSAMLINAPSVIVNARAVAADISRFHPEARARVFVLPFSAAPEPAWLQAQLTSKNKYGLAGRYFIICNQFWKHKDHATAFEAFAQIAGNRPDIDLVCTGPTDDYRDPEYSPTLERALVRGGIATRVHILGMVPKADQINLLKGSIALIQPTLFEGGPGGGAVFDAAALGVRCIVSDISVNRELEDPNIPALLPSWRCKRPCRAPCGGG